MGSPFSRIPFENLGEQGARRVKHFRMSEHRCWGEFENVPRTAAQPYEIFVGAAFFRLHFLAGKKGSWGMGQRPNSINRKDRES